MELTADQIASAMLDMYKTEDDWNRDGLVGHSQDPEGFRKPKQIYCLLGARAVIQYGELGNRTTDMILSEFRDDEYLLKLTAVIREQYPELENIAGRYWNNIGLIYIFNDEHAGFPDIRKVIEKAAAR